jgi:hypothetical protein
MQKVEFYVGTVGQDGQSRDLTPVDDLLKSQFDGFTKTTATGFWNGQTEVTVVYTVILTGALIYPALIANLAANMAMAADQEKVLWTIHNLNAGLSGPGDTYY